MFWSRTSRVLAVGFRCKSTVFGSGRAFFDSGTNRRPKIQREQETQTRDGKRAREAEGERERQSEQHHERTASAPPREFERSHPTHYPPNEVDGQSNEQLCGSDVRRCGFGIESLFEPTTNNVQLTEWFHFCVVSKRHNARIDETTEPRKIDEPRHTNGSNKLQKFDGFEWNHECHVRLLRHGLVCRTNSTMWW